jgi:TldD protein
MRSSELFGAIDSLKERGREIVAGFARARHDVAYADLRFEVVFHRSAAAINGDGRDSCEDERSGLGVSVHAMDGRGGCVGHGQAGVELGRLALDGRKLVAAIRDAFEEARARARLSAREKAAAIRGLGARALALGAAQPLAPRPAVCEEFQAVFRTDPRTLKPEALKRLALDASRAVKALGPEIAFNAVAAMAEIRSELFISTEGTMVAEAFAFAQGDCYVVAESRDGHQESYDTIGQQRGFEALAEGYRGELLSNPKLGTFCVELAAEARELARAPALKPPAGEVTVVTDPHFNALLAHEIVGHPCEADRALKMEAAYAGRSWLLRTMADSEIGRTVGSPLVSACSDPTLYGYGHYRYDHEGTAARPVVHIDRGVFRGFINSRATAAALGVEPNGSARASEACHVPLVRMSNTFLMGGQTPPEKIVAEVEHGYYVAGHLIPSIAESRENFRISARRVYEIDHGRLGRLYRAGSVIADSRRFFMNVDAVGSDLKFVAIPNCGKGQPMQVKRMSNGGPTIRSRARLGGGR